MVKQKVYLKKNNEQFSTYISESDTLLVFSLSDSDAVEYTANIQEANYICVNLPKLYTDHPEISACYEYILNLRSLNPSATILITGGLFHVDESDNKESLIAFSNILQDMDSNCIMLTLNHNFKFLDLYNIRYYDFLFNRARMSYFDHSNVFFNTPCESTQWPITRGYADADAFQLADYSLDAREVQQHYNLGGIKTFLSSMFAREENIYSKTNPGYAVAGLNAPGDFIVRDALRIDLKNQLKSYPGFVGGDGSWLATDGDTHSQLKTTLTGGFANNAPPSKLYFESSVISIYVETLMTDPNVFCPTEKTFVPLIQGHFILPFGIQGFVRGLIERYDVQMPDWIDWQYYDSEEDGLSRWFKYKMVVFDTLNKGEDFLWDHKISEEGQRILQHNRALFTRKKDSLLSAINT